MSFVVIEMKYVGNLYNSCANFNISFICAGKWNWETFLQNVIMLTRI